MGLFVAAYASSIQLRLLQYFVYINCSYSSLNNCSSCEYNSEIDLHVCDVGWSEFVVYGSTY